MEEGILHPSSDPLTQPTTQSTSPSTHYPKGKKTTTDNVSSTSKNNHGSHQDHCSSPGGRSQAVGKMELLGLVKDLRKTLNSQAYHGMKKAVSLLIYKPNCHLGPEDKKKIDRMIVGEIRATIEASLNNMLIVKTPGDKSTTFYLNFITGGGPKINSVDLTAKEDEDEDDVKHT
jgi:hypothetical protein